MKILKGKLILTDEEIKYLAKASDILDNIAQSMDRAVSVDWSDFDDDEIWVAVEIIDSFTGKKH